MNPKHELRPVDANELRSIQGGGILNDIAKAVGKVVDYVRDRITPRPRLRLL